MITCMCVLHCIMCHVCVQIEEASYKNIALSLGATSPSDILFATDNINEAIAADKAGWNVIVTDRPGNQPITDCQFKMVKDLSSIA